MQTKFLSYLFLSQLSIHKNHHWNLFFFFFLFLQCQTLLPNFAQFAQTLKEIKEEEEERKKMGRFKKGL